MFRIEWTTVENQTFEKPYAIDDRAEAMAEADSLLADDWVTSVTITSNKS